MSFNRIYPDIAGWKEKTYSYGIIHPTAIFSTNTTNLEIVPLPKNESRCRYCNTRAFEDER